MQEDLLIRHAEHIKPFFVYRLEFFYWKTKHLQ